MEKQKKIKKKKIFIGLGIVSTIIIIPIVAVACGSESSNSSTSGGSTSGNEVPSKPSVTQKEANQNIIDSIASNINNISFLVNSTQAKLTPAEAAKDLQSTTTITLDSLSAYIDTSYINNVLSNKNVTTNYTIGNTNSTDGSLSINLKLLLGLGNEQVTKNTIININGFAAATNSTNASINFSTLKNIASNLEALNLSASSSASTKNPLEIENTLNSQTNITLSNLSNYFDTNSIFNIISTTPSLNVVYKLGQILLDQGIINIIIQLSIGTGAEQANINIVLPINGFLKINSVQAENQNIIDSIASDINNVSFLTNSTQAKLTPTEAAKNLQSTTPITLNSLGAYFDTTFINSVLLNKNVNAFYTIGNINSTDGSLSINIKLLLGSGDAQVTKNININIDGFTSTTSSNTNNNFKTLNSMSSNLEALNLVVSSSALTKNPLEVENTLNAKTNITLLDLGAYIDTNSISKIISTTPSLNVAYKLGQVLLNTGIINIIIQLSIGTGAEQANIDVVLPIKGFLTGDEIKASENQIANQNSINSLLQQFSVLNLVTTNPNISPQTVEFNLNKINPLSLSSFDTYFNVESLTSILNSTAPKANVIYSLQNVNDNNITNGTITINLDITLGTGVELVSGSTNLIISGFASPNSIVNNINLLVTNKTIQTYGSGWITLVNASNLEYFIKGLPTLDNYFTYEFTISNTDTSTGILTFQIIVKDKNDSTIKAESNVITLGGFVTKTQADEVDALANNIVASNVVGINNSSIIASNVVSSTLQNYIDQTKLPKLSNEYIYTYIILNSNDELGTLTIEIEVYKSSVTNLTIISNSGPKITLKGFKKVFS